MRSEILKCDRCGVTETIPAGAQGKMELLMVGICVIDPRSNNYSYTSNVPQADVKNQSQWCRECVISIGLQPAWNDEQMKKVPPTKPTLEDQLLEILKQFVNENAPQPQ